MRSTRSDKLYDNFEYVCVYGLLKIAHKRVALNSNRNAVFFKFSVKHAGGLMTAQIWLEFVAELETAKSYKCSTEYKGRERERERRNARAPRTSGDTEYVIA